MSQKGPTLLYGLGGVGGLAGLSGLGRLSGLGGLNGLGGVDVRHTNVGVVVGGWILGEISKFDSLVVGPREVNNQL